MRRRWVGRWVAAIAAFGLLLSVSPILSWADDTDIEVGAGHGNAPGSGEINTEIGIEKSESSDNDSAHGSNVQTSVEIPECAIPKAQDLPADDPRWGSKSPETHVLYQVDCVIIENGDLVYAPTTWIVEIGDQPPSPDSRVVAHQVWDHMKTEIPAPEPTTSPDFRTAINPELHWPVAWVNVWNWVWAEPDVWRPVTDTLSVQGVSVTVTAEPVALRLDPGDGSPVVACSNTPGVAYFPPVDNVVDPARDPNSSEIGGCGWKYLQATSRKSPSQATIFIDWDASWTSNTGESGDLGEITTFRDTEQFVVVERRVVIAPNDSGGR